MDVNEFLPLQLAAMLLAFGVLLAIACFSGNRGKDRQGVSPAPDEKLAGNQGQPAETRNSAVGDRGSCVI